MLRINPRDDDMIKQNAEKVFDPTSFPGQVTVPAYKALSEFFDDFLIGQDFPDLEVLERVLALWPKFYEDSINKMPNARTDKAFDRLIFIHDNRAIVLPGGPRSFIFVAQVTTT